MLRTILFSVLAFGMNTAAFAGAAAPFPSGPANLFASDTDGQSTLWVGGGVARGLFNRMTDAREETSGTAVARLGENVSCLHDPANDLVEYSCVLNIESSTGRAIGR